MEYESNSDADVLAAAQRRAAELTAETEAARALWVRPARCRARMLPALTRRAPRRR